MTSFIQSLNAKRSNFNKDDKGFTLIELLVVVIIIGILAAIAIPIYIGVQNNAKDASVQSDLTNAKTAIITSYTKSATSAMPTTLTVAALGEYGFTQGANTTSISYSPTGTTGSPASFCLVAPAGSDPTKKIYITSGAGATGPLAAAPTGC